MKRALKQSHEPMHIFRIFSNESREVVQRRESWKHLNDLHRVGDEEAKAFQHVEPVRLNPKNLNMDAFNKMFEQTRMPI
jgi:DNA mismatch repair protein MutH